MYCTKKEEDKKECMECNLEKNKEEIIALFEKEAITIEDKRDKMEELEKELKSIKSDIETYESFEPLIRIWQSEEKIKSNIRYCVFCGVKLEKNNENVLEGEAYHCYYCDCEDHSYICPNCRRKANKKIYQYCAICGDEIF